MASSLRRRVSYEPIRATLSPPTAPEVKHAGIGRRCFSHCRAKLLNFKAIAIFNIVAIVIILTLLFRFTSLSILLTGSQKEWQGRLLQDDFDGTLPDSIYTSSDLRGGTCEVHPPDNVDWGFLLRWKKPDPTSCPVEEKANASEILRGMIWFDLHACPNGRLSYRLSSGGETSKWIRVEESSVPLGESEQVIVRCKRSGKPNTYDFHMSLRANKEAIYQAIRNRQNHADDYNDGKERPQLNLIVLMIDSLSREHALRALPETLRFLKRLHISRRTPFKLYDYTRFNTVGRGTKSNFSPVMFGMPGDKFAESKVPPNEEPSALLSSFLDAGFITGFVEEDCCENDGSMGRILGKKAFEDYDSEDVSVFKKLVRGLGVHSLGNIFCEVMDAMGVETFFAASTRERICFAGEFVHVHTMKYLRSFFEAYSGRKRTAGNIVVVQNNIAHEASYRRVAQLDLDLLNFLKWFTRSVPNAGVVLLGDHGLGYGDLADTPTIQFEYNLPPLFILLPDEYLQSLPIHMRRNLLLNQNQLVRGIDLHATLIDLLYGTKQQMTERGTSFFRPMEKRTCKSLDIPVTRCSCATFAHENPDKSIFRIIAIELAHILNRSVETFPKCLPVELHRAKEVRIISEGPSDNEGSQACEINIEVRAKGVSATYTEDFLFSLIKSPEEWIKPSTSPVVSFRVGTNFDTSNRNFRGSEGIVFGKPKQLWMVLEWVAEDKNRPDRQLLAEFINSKGIVAKAYRMKVTSDWAISWHNRHVDQFIRVGAWTIRLTDERLNTVISTFSLDLVDEQKSVKLGVGEACFRRHWKVLSTTRRSVFSPFTSCVPRGAAPDKCICDKDA